MATGIKKLSNTFVWILMGLLIIGLAGFGAVNFNSSMSSVAQVGDEEVTVDAYLRELQREQRALQAQGGQSLTIAQMAAFGLDRVVLQRLISIAAIDNEVKNLGISIGDENLRKELAEIPAFQAASGKFDRQAYSFALQNVNLNEKNFEADLRRESARTLVQGAIVVGAKMPKTLTDTLTNYIGARRSFSYVQLSADQVALTQVMPTDAELQSYYDDNQGSFTLPETKRITYARLSPEMIMDSVEVDEVALRKLYDERADEYQVPERRLVERLVFADEQSAAGAKAQLDVGGTTFEALVEARGLALSDVDLGDVTTDDLGAASDSIFAAEVGAVVGPHPTDLGPALFRINGHLEARITSYEDAMPELRDELAADRARRLIEQQAEEINDLLAGGATLEDLATESDMQVATINWNGKTSEGISAYEGFRTAASVVTLDDFPEAEFLGDGSLFALRLDEILPERPEPFETAKQKVLDAWNADRVAAALQAQADALFLAAKEAGTFPEESQVKTETGLTRTAYLDNTPADMMNQIFTMEPGDFKVITGEDSTVVVHLDAVLPTETSEEMQLMADALGTQLDQAISEALFTAFVADAQLRAAPRVDQQALNAVQANFQ
ncbi:peptidylprolyl isomerase [Pseudophaeobacter flagellatus]|uniref:peptidylprolyl isomerase n=1 Tax=Pseudophaeobacter flagellatus TaxID=2899119 RepID=UPI001E594551|nr:peptidylprolyl isomerase [Pseudophaeobacter flagellatus]MCD9147766.1 SurA N-terminal domain-containing protein [Pseudophaeobacter flagellatus]